MDQNKGGKQNTLDFKCNKIINGDGKWSSLDPVPLEKPGVVENENLKANIACPTPENISLPEKYGAIAELFNCMITSLKLLDLSKSSRTFQNVATQMAVLSKRNFTHEHLAQIKYILPEALQIDKILVPDRKSLCMKPDMQITLLFDVVKGHSQVSDGIALGQVFASRLYEFFTRHGEAIDVPVDKLPEPFAQKVQIQVQDQLPVDDFMECQPASIEAEHFPEKLIGKPRFSRHFSQNSVAEKGKTKNLTGETVDQITSCLVDMVDVIHSIFKSVNYVPITKGELVYKIIANKIDVVEKGEVEEQIDLLGKLVPDWICRRLAPSGDIMYSIKALSDLDSVRAKLLGA